MDLPMHALARSLAKNGRIRFFEQMAAEFPASHLKDLVFDEVDAHRSIGIRGHRLVNFGSDSYLGLDQDSRVQEAIVRGTWRWGTQHGTSRAFASVGANRDAEAKLAEWLGSEAVIVYPSVTLANVGAIPGLVGRQDLVVVDEHAHNSVQEGVKLARANGVRVVTFSHCDPLDLERSLTAAGDYRCALVAIDGVYSMSGGLPPLSELQAVCLDRRAVLYIDDAHGTGVLGRYGRGTVLDALGSYDNTLVAGCLSKAFSCLGGFIGCSEELKRALKMVSNTYIFGGPIPPPYLEAICTVCDILMSPEYDCIMDRLRSNHNRLVAGARQLGLAVLGGETPIISVLVGDEGDTLEAGRFLFDRGFFVPSVTFPAVPYHAGLLRVQVNANHLPESIDALLAALQELTRVIPLPKSDAPVAIAAA